MECSPENINTVLESKGYNYLKLYYDEGYNYLKLYCDDLQKNAFVLPPNDGINTDQLWKSSTISEQIVLNQLKKAIQKTSIEVPITIFHRFQMNDIKWKWLKDSYKINDDLIDYYKSEMMVDFKFIILIRNMIAIAVEVQPEDKQDTIVIGDQLNIFPSFIDLILKFVKTSNGTTLPTHNVRILPKKLFTDDCNDSFTNINLEEIENIGQTLRNLVIKINKTDKCKLSSKEFDRFYMILSGLHSIESEKNTKIETIYDYNSIVEINQKPYALWPTARSGHLMFATSNYLYVFGGFDYNYHTNTGALYNEIWQYNIEMRTWRRMPDKKKLAPIECASSCGTIIGHDIIIFGGSGKGLSEISDKMLTYSLRKGKWWLDLQKKASAGNTVASESCDEFFENLKKKVPALKNRPVPISKNQFIETILRLEYKDQLKVRSLALNCIQSLDCKRRSNMDCGENCCTHWKTSDWDNFKNWLYEDFPSWAIKLGPNIKENEIDVETEEEVKERLSTVEEIKRKLLVNNPLKWKRESELECKQCQIMPYLKPMPKFGASMAISPKKEVFIYSGSYGREFDKAHMHIYDLKSFNWSELVLCKNHSKSAPEPRYKHQVITVDEGFYLFGGSALGKSFGFEKLYFFNFKKFQWTIIKCKTSNKNNNGKPIFPLSRGQHTCVLTPDKKVVYMLGGAHSSINGQNLKDIWKIKLDTVDGFVWSKVMDFHYPITFHSAAVTTEGCMYLFGGVNKKSNLRTKRLYRIWLSPPPLKELAWRRMQQIIRHENGLDKNELINKKILNFYDLPRNIIERHTDLDASL